MGEGYDWLGEGSFLKKTKRNEWQGGELNIEIKFDSIRLQMVDGFMPGEMRLVRYRGAERTGYTVA